MTPEKPGVYVIKDNVEEVVKHIKHLTEREVLIGIPATHAARTDTSFTNAAIGYINQYGSPAKNIPARPHLDVGIRNVSDQLVTRLKKAAQEGMDGKVGNVENALAACGMLAVGAVQMVITAGIPPPLAPRTIYARQHRKVARRMGTTPLEDTGQYRQHITYVVRNKQGIDVEVPIESVTPGRQSDITSPEFDVGGTEAG